MCSGDVKSVDYPTMDDPNRNVLLKSSGRLKQKKEANSGLPVTKKQFFEKVIHKVNI